jgi:hypothetical protein
MQRICPRGRAHLSAIRRISEILILIPTLKILRRASGLGPGPVLLRPSSLRRVVNPSSDAPVRTAPGVCNLRYRASRGFLMRDHALHHVYCSVLAFFQSESNCLMREEG